MNASGCAAGMLAAGIAMLIGGPAAGRAADLPGGQVDLAVSRVSAPASVQAGKKVTVTIQLQNRTAANVTGGSLEVEIGKSSRRITGIALKGRGSGTIKVEGVARGTGVCQIAARIDPPAGVSDPNPANDRAVTRMRVTAAGAGTRSSSDPPLEEVTFVYHTISLGTLGRLR